MSQKANPYKIALFILGSLGMVLLAIFLFCPNIFLSNTAKYVLFFNQSINGLDEGAPVKFKGVQIGQVKKILITFNEDKNKACIPVIIEVDHSAIQSKSLSNLELGLQARLQFLSFVTGVRFIELDYNPNLALMPAAPNPLNIYKFPEIPIVGSGLENMDTQLAEIVEKLSKVNFLGLAEHSETILIDIEKAAKAFDFKSLSQDINGITHKINSILKDEKFDTTVSNFYETVQHTRDLSQVLNKNMPSLIDQTKTVLFDMHKTLKAVTHMVRNLSSIVDPSSTLFFELEKTLQEIAETASSIQSLANYLEQNPESILSGKHLLPKTANP